MTGLSIRIDLGPGRRIGPGKIELLEGIARHGSIAAAGRAMDMSYRRAWNLVDELNTMFTPAIVASQSGGKRGGGAVLTPFGASLVKRYRAMERAAAKAVKAELKALDRDVPARRG